MELYSTPELQRVPLDSLMLQMIAMGLPDARKFPFIEAPNPENIENAIISLKNLVSKIHNKSTGCPPFTNRFVFVYRVHLQKMKN